MMLPLYFGSSAAMTLPGLNAIAKNTAQTAEAIEQRAERAAEQQLIERVLAGERNAYRSLVERYQERVFSIAFGVVGRREDAEDVAQEAFVKAYRSLSSFKGQSSFYTWIYRITFNLAIDAMRKRKRRFEQLEVSVDAVDPEGRTLVSLVEENNPEIEVSRGQLASRIQRAMLKLSPEHRAVVTLREVDGLSYQEISEAMKCSLGTVMSRLHHARKKLQQALTDD